MNNSERRGFICAGCWTLDHIKLIDTWPGEEELARISDVDQLGGGSAHNVGIDLKKLDASLPVSTIGLLGNDEDGDYLFHEAQLHKLDTKQLKRTDQRATSYTDVMSVLSSGKRTFFHYPGANDLLEPEHFDFTDSTSRILHLGLLSLHAGMDAPQGSGNGWSTVLAKARAQGLKTSIEMVSVDADTNRRLVMPCLPHLNYLIVNDHEIGSIADVVTIEDGHTRVDRCLMAARKVMHMSNTQSDSVHSGAAQTQAEHTAVEQTQDVPTDAMAISTAPNGTMELVVVHYPEGAICITQAGQEFTTRSLSVPQSLIASSVGAGDAFVAGFLYGVHEKWSIDESLSLAHTVAAASLRSTTTVGAVESIERCQQFAITLATR